MMLRRLCLTAAASQYEAVAEKAIRENGSHIHYLRGLCELATNAREGRRRTRHWQSSRLPADKTLATLEQDCLPLKVRQQLSALLEGEFVKKAKNLLVFGLPGRGKSHLVCAVAHELLLYHDYRVWFTRASQLVHDLLKAKRDLVWDGLLRKLDRFDVVIVDEIG
jgi:DNA replication protein DnaC